MKQKIIGVTVVCCSLFLIFSLLAFAAGERGIRRKSSESGQAEPRTALVIGNADYQSSPLRNPVNDARDMEKTLKSLGFEVVCKENADKKAMEEAIRDFGKTLQNNKGIGLFYYSGHGMQMQGSNYLIPTDATIESESDVRYESVDAGRVLGKMEDAGNELNIVILDACRSNKFSKGFKNIEDGLAKMDAPKGSLIAYATAPDKVASDGKERNGVYTKYLLKYINIPKLKIEDVFKRVRADVAGETGDKQIPWESSSLIGDFYFADSGGAAITTPAPEKESSLIVRPDVSDATVWINDKKMGTGTLNFRQIQPGVYRMRVEKEGYLPYQTSVEIKAGEAKEVPVYLAKPEPKPEPVAESVSPGKKIINSIGMEFVYIPPGTFMMGSPENELERDKNEKQYQVTLTKGFYMQTTEVTQGQWKAVMGNNPSKFKDCRDCPVEQVSWDDVQVFIEKLNQKESRNYRLPTEAEWEYAARAGSTTAFANGNITEVTCGDDPNLDAMGWYCGNSDSEIHPVAKKQANVWGLYDMHGNVSEWCQDWYGYYSSDSVTDPTGPSSSSAYVLRGGGWTDYAGNCRSAYRNGNSPDSRHDYLGFRLVLPAGQQG